MTARVPAKPELRKKTVTELTALYNSLFGAGVKAFRTKGQAIDRIQAAASGELPREKGLVRRTAERLLKTRKPYSRIAEEIAAVVPGAHTTVRSLQWYASKMRAAGVRVPDRTPERAAAA